MPIAPRRWRETFAGALVLLIGVGVAAEGLSLRLGTLTRMGPGFFPCVLGTILMLLGALITATGGGRADADVPVRLDVRGAVCIVIGCLAFIGLGMAFGFAAAAFSAIFISAMGDREATLRSSALLAAAMTVAGAVVFTNLLSIPFPIFHWF